MANSDSPEVAVGAIPEGTFNFGRNNFSPRETTVNRYQFIDNQTYIAGNHNVKYGADLLFDRIFNFFPGLFGGSYTFSSLAIPAPTEANPNATRTINGYETLALNRPSRYRQSFAGAGTSGGTTYPNSSEYGFFVQDDWRATPKLTVNLGLRYDYQAIAKPPISNPNPALAAAGFDTGFQPKDKNNIAPRFGVAYAFDEKTVVRGGYGLFYARTPSILTGTAHSQNGIQVVAIDVNCNSTPALCPVFPNVFASAPAGATLARVNLFLFDREYEQPFTQQARLQFEREVFANTTVSVQYTMFKGQDLTRTRNANLSAPVATNATVSGGAMNGETFTFQRFSNPPLISTYQRISLFESSAKSFYQGLTFELNRRFADRLQFNASYTLSKAKDDKPDQTSVVPGGGDDAKIAENQFDLSGEYGRSDLDVRHRFIFSPVYETGTFKYSDNKIVRALLSDYLFTGIFTAQSGIAYSALVGGDPNGDGITVNDRVPGTRRNQFSTPATYQTDLRVGRIIRFGERKRLSLFAEGFNIFNRPNVQSVFNNVYNFSPGSGTTLSRLVPVSAPNTFGTPRGFISSSPSFTFNSSYSREFQLGARFDF